MMRREMRRVVLLFCVALAAAACHREHATHTGTASNTQTVAPAAAQPAPTGTDAMTQTVDVEDSRSEEDGGTLTEKGTAATATAAPAKKVPSAKTKKH